MTDIEGTDTDGTYGVPLERFVSFARSDVITVATALMVRGVHHEDYGDAPAIYACHTCFGQGTRNEDDFRHEDDCPILIAQDLLTGS